jgi:hypothetical protein
MPSEMWEELVLERSGGKMCKKEEDKIFRKKGFLKKKCNFDSMPTDRVHHHLDEDDHHRINKKEKKILQKNFFPHKVQLF